MATAPSIPLPNPARRFSELGISSFIFSILSAAAVCLDLGVFALLAIRHQSTTAHAFALLFVLVFFGILTFTVVGLAIGLAGLFQPDRLKIFSILGAMLNLLILVSLLILLMIAVLAPGPARLIDGSLAWLILV
jgi:hypothetical protein